MCKILLLQTSCGSSVNNYATEVLYCFEFDPPSGRSHIGSPFISEKIASQCSSSFLSNPWIWTSGIMGRVKQNVSRRVQFSLLPEGMYALGKAHKLSTSSLRSSPNIAFDTVPMSVWLTMVLSRPFKEECRALAALPTPLLQAIDGVVSLALCLHIASQAPQQFRSSEM